MAKRKMSQSNRAAQNLSKLPTFCYTKHPETKEPIRIFRGEEGFYPAAKDGVDVDEINGVLGITHEQEMAMLSGSMFGWHTEGADPETWENNAKFQARLRTEGKNNAKEMRAAIAKATGGQ